MPAKSKITFVVPNNLQQELRERVIHDNYGLRGKSKWIAEATEKLLSFENFPELVNYGNELHGFGKVETVVIEYQLKTKLDAAIIQLRRQFPTLEGPQSRILRTAILQRLLRK